MNEPNAYVIADLLREGMARGEQPALTLTSNSMYPLLKAGDQIRITAVAVGELEPGDVVTFIDASNPDQLTTHRFWGVVEQPRHALLVMRGDRPSYFDPPCPDTHLVGRVAARLRNGRDLSLESGSGAWLNQQLATLAAREIAYLAGVDSSRLHAVVTAAALPDAAPVNPVRSRTVLRLYKRAVLAAGLLLTVFSRLVHRT